jgi:hypothetical protein
MLVSFGFLGELACLDACKSIVGITVHSYGSFDQRLRALRPRIENCLPYLQTVQFLSLFGELLLLGSASHPSPAPSLWSALLH